MVAKDTVDTQLVELFSRIAHDDILPKEDFITLVKGAETPEARTLYIDEDREAMWNEVDEDGNGCVTKDEVPQHSSSLIPNTIYTFTQRHRH